MKVCIGYVFVIVSVCMGVLHCLPYTKIEREEDEKKIKLAIVEVVPKCWCANSSQIVDAIVKPDRVEIEMKCNHTRARHSIHRHTWIELVSCNDCRHKPFCFSLFSRSCVTISMKFIEELVLARCNVWYIYDRCKNVRNRIDSQNCDAICRSVGRAFIAVFL